MSHLWQLILAHQTTAALVSMWLFSNIVTALPTPDGQSSNSYKFVFALFHGLAGSLPRVFPQARVFDAQPNPSKP